MSAVNKVLLATVVLLVSVVGASYPSVAQEPTDKQKVATALLTTPDKCASPCLWTLQPNQSTLGELQTFMQGILPFAVGTVTEGVARGFFADGVALHVSNTTATARADDLISGFYVRLNVSQAKAVGIRVDDFAPAAMVSSLGIGVVGIEGENETSAAIWGSAEINEGIGYSVIVRYGHLYVLYGHLIEVDSKIYVGIRVDESTRLGSLGTFPGSDLHLHIEIRSFGDTVAEEALVAKTTGLGNLGRGNEYGILELRAPQAEFYYDIPQFFVTIPFSYEQDYDGGTAIAAVSPLGPQLQNEATIVWGANCHLRYRTDPAVRTILTPVYLPTTVTTPSVLRGFKNGYLDDSPSPYLTPEPNSHR